jgi:hypothetical protein
MPNTRKRPALDDQPVEVISLETQPAFASLRVGALSGFAAEDFAAGAMLLR